MIDSKNPTDKELITAIKNNDSDSFKILYYRYFNPLIRFAWYRIHSIENARDLVQDIFYNVWIKREYINPDKSIKAYLYKSLLNSIINLGKLASSKNILLDNIDELKDSMDNSNLEFNLDIHLAIDKLPGKIRDTFILSRLEGYDYNEIASIFNVSVKAIEKRMSKAFGLLRKYLIKEESTK